MSETIEALSATIRDRQTRPREGSYTCRLFAAGRQEILKKVGEEAVEVVLAGAMQEDERVVYESADLVYHLLVMLAERGLCWSDVESELRRRFH